MDTKNIELEKPIDKVTLLGVELNSEEETDTEKENLQPKEKTTNEKEGIQPIQETTTEKTVIPPIENPSTEKREFHPVENYHPENERHSHSHIVHILSICVLVFIILLCIAFLIFTFVNNQNENMISIFENSFTALKTWIYPIDIELALSLDEEQLKNALNDISSKLPDTVIESGYYIDGNNLIVTRGSEGNVINVDQMYTYIKNGIANLTLKNRTLEIATVSKQPSEINIEKIYDEIYKEPVDAYYTQEPFAVYPSENGLDFAISLDEAKELLSEEKSEYVIPLQTLYPNVTTNMIGTEAFPDMLSTYSTRYSASDRDRTTNLQLAASKINGTVLMPGETFSYNKVVGERTISAGYKEAPIYVSGEVVDGLGGGICQITSTLYNAVLYANLEIVERSNHQFVPSYVTASRDATVVYGSIDFKFENNRDYPIKLVCSVSGGIAKFDIYGLRTDNEYEVEISSHVTGSTANSTYSEAYRILKQNGQVIRTELLSKDTYKRH